MDIEIVTNQLANQQDIDNLINQLKNVDAFKSALTLISQDEQQTLQLKHFLDQVGSIIDSFNDQQKEQLLFTIHSVLNNNPIVEKQMYIINSLLSQLYQTQNKFTQAALVLNSTKFTQLDLSLNQQVEFQLKIIQLFLQAKQVKDAQLVMHKCLQHRQKLDQTHRFNLDLYLAQINEIEGRYHQAAQSYYNLSLNKQQVDENQYELLQKAIICGIMDQAGPKQINLLANIYKDPRTQQLQIAKILKKMQQFNSQSYDNKELTLGQLQKKKKNCLLENIWQKKIIRESEHNILSLSKIYEQINLNSLSRHLRLNELESQEFLLKMIVEQRIDAEIDQVSGYVTFIQESSQEFSQKIEIFCNQLHHIQQMIN